ncbi:MAG: TRAP transporter small permease [Rhizobiaceae bacterium]
MQLNRVQRIDRFMGRFHHIVGALVGISLGLFAVSISLDVFLRFFGLGNLAGLQEIIEYALFAGVFLAAPWVLRLGAHIRVDLLQSGLSKSASLLLNRALDALGLIICLVLVWFGIANLSQSLAFQSMQMKYFNVPEWWLLTVFVVSFAMLALEFCFRLMRGGGATDASVESVGGM